MLNVWNKFVLRFFFQLHSRCDYWWWKSICLNLDCGLTHSFNLIQFYILHNFFCFFSFTFVRNFLISCLSFCWKISVLLRLLILFLLKSVVDDNLKNFHCRNDKNTIRYQKLSMKYTWLCMHRQQKKDH